MSFRKTITREKNIKAGQDLEKVDALIEQAFKQRHIDGVSSMALATKAHHLSTAIGYTKGMANALLNIGFQELTQSKYEKAFITLNQSLKLFQGIEYPTGIAHANYYLGVLFLRLGNYENAMESQVSSLSIRKTLGDHDGIASCKSQIAYLNAQFGLTDKALMEFDECIAIFRNNNNGAGLAAALMTLGTVEMNLNKLSEAKEHLSESLKIRKGLKEANGWLGSANYLADVHLKEGNKEEALRLLDDALNFALSQKPLYAPGICRLRTNMAKANVQLGDEHTAIMHLEKALALALTSNQLYQLHDIYFELAMLYKRTAFFDKALAYYEKFHESKERVINLNATTKLKNLEMLSKVEMQEKEVEIHRIKYTELKERNKIIREARRKSDNLLFNILPRKTAFELKRNGSAKARHYELATILFTDFVNFTASAEKLTPARLVENLHKYFSAFDEIITRNQIEKIKTIGDSYMATGGVPVANTTNPIQVVKAALEITEFVKMQNDPLFQIRVGVHSGSIIAGIVGHKKFAYDIWGDTVNIASRLESTGAAGKVNVSGVTHELIKDVFVCTHRGKIEAKRKGMIDMYFVEGPR